MAVPAVLHSKIPEANGLNGWTGCENAASEFKTEPAYNEDKRIGAVSLSLITTYFTSMRNKCFWVVVFFAIALQQITSLGTKLWIRIWAHEFDKSVEKSGKPQGDHDHVNSVSHLSVYGLTCLVYIFISFARDLMTFSGVLKASTRMYNSLLDSDFHARLIFFHEVAFG
jgi:hypothetical protein